MRSDIKSITPEADRAGTETWRIELSCGGIVYTPYLVLERFKVMWIVHEDVLLHCEEVPL